MYYKRAALRFLFSVFVLLHANTLLLYRDSVLSVHSLVIHGSMYRNICAPCDRVSDLASFWGPVSQSTVQGFTPPEGVK